MERLKKIGGFRNIIYTRKFLTLMLVIAACAFGALLWQAWRLIGDVEAFRKREAQSVTILCNTTRALKDQPEYDIDRLPRMRRDSLVQLCKQLATSLDTYNEVAQDVMIANDYVPVLVVDERDSIVNWRNLPDEEMGYEEMTKLFKEIKALNRDTLMVNLGNGQWQTIYYGETLLTSRLKYVTALQVMLIVMFLSIVYMALTRARRRERDTLWKGLALETAHQLGTPISALGAWRDVLQTGLITSTEEVATEMTYDIARLQSVAERFSKIGSTPDMSTTPIDDDLQYVYNYLRSRLSKSVTLGLDIAAPGLPVRHEPTLIRWAVENICKNAADAISGTGSITVRQSADEKNVIVDIIDTGKGMDNKTRKHIFDAGYTTKTRGWGIGLALVKRIITEYHKGKVYVAASKIGEGTTFRIELPRR